MHKGGSQIKEKNEQTIWTRKRTIWAYQKKEQQILKVTKGKDHKLYGLSKKKEGISYIKGHKNGEGITNYLGFQTGQIFLSLITI